MNERGVALEESLGDLQAGYKTIFLVLRGTSSQEHDDMYFHANFMQKVDELKNKSQPLFDDCVDAVYSLDADKGRRIGVISIQKLGAWKIAVNERELLEKLGLDRDHWWVLVRMNHM